MKNIKWWKDRLFIMDKVSGRTVYEKIILYSILAITIFSSTGCSGKKTALNDEVDKKVNNDINISLSQNKKQNKK